MTKPALRPKLTRKQVRELFDYDRPNGTLIRRVGSGSIRAGKIAGSLGINGHVRSSQVQVNGYSYAVRSIVWTWLFGALPAKHFIKVTPRNLPAPAPMFVLTAVPRIKPKPKKLRPKTKPDYTCAVTRRAVTPVTPVTNAIIGGITWSKTLRVWVIRIQRNKCQTYVGSAASFDEAVCRLLAVEQCLNYGSPTPAFLYVKNNIQTQNGPKNEPL